MTVDELRRMFDYNRWANEEVAASVTALPADQLTRRFGDSGSIRDTISHIAGSEWVWLERWHGRSPSAGPEWTKGDVSGVLEKLRELDGSLTSALASLDDEGLSRVIHYTNLRGENHSYPLGDTMLHVVNHGSYHRGQVASKLREIGVAPRSTDFVLYLGVGKK